MKTPQLSHIGGFKHLMTLVMVMLVSMGSAFAQANLFGLVTSTNTQQPVPNRTVNIIGDSTNGTPFATSVQTNQQGQFAVAVPAQNPAGTRYTIWTPDCNNNGVYAVVTMAPNQPQNVTLQICTNAPVPSCRATITATPNNVAPFTYNLLASFFCQNGGAASNLVWNLGPNGGTPGQPSRPLVHTFPGPGQYNVCISYLVGNRLDSFCQVINVGPSTQCVPRMTYVRDTVGGGSPYRYQFFNNSNCVVMPPAQVTYTWTYNNTIIRGVASPILTLAPGLNTVCLNAEINGQVQTTCVQITTPGNPQLACATLPAPQVFQRHNGLTVHFGTNAVNVNPRDSVSRVAYSWTFGDGGTSNLARPFHTYNAPGSYAVCLVVTYGGALQGCVKTVCDTIIVRTGQPPVPPLQRNVIGGFVSMGNQSATDYAVELVGLTNNGVYRLRTLVADSSFRFDSIPAGRYVVRAWLTRVNPQFRQYFPTYYGNRVLWRFARVIAVGNNSGYHDASINLIPRRTRGSAGFAVRGRVTGVTTPNGRMAAPAANEPNTIVMLMDEDGSPIEPLFLDQNRDYEVNDLPAGTYKLAVESPNMPSDEITVTVGNMATTSTVNFSNFNDNMAGTVTALEAKQMAANVSLYPVPATETLTISGALGARYSVITTTGQVMTAGQLNADAETKLAVDELPSGFYLIQLELTNGQKVVKRFSKQ